MTSIYVASPDRPLLQELAQLLVARNHTVQIAATDLADPAALARHTPTASDVAVVDLREAARSDHAAMFRGFHEVGARVLALLDASASAAEVRAAVRAGADAALPVGGGDLEDAVDLAELLAIGTPAVRPLS